MLEMSWIMDGAQFDHVLYDVAGINYSLLGLCFCTNYDFFEKVIALVWYAYRISNTLRDACSEISMKLDTFWKRAMISLYNTYNSDEIHE